MTIELPPALERLVREKIAAGDYQDAADVISSALELLALHDSSPDFRRKMLLAALDEGDADLRAGRGVTLSTPTEIDRLIADLKGR